MFPFLFPSLCDPQCHHVAKNEYDTTSYTGAMWLDCILGPYFAFPVAVAWLCWGKVQRRVKPVSQLGSFCVEMAMWDLTGYAVFSEWLIGEYMGHRNSCCSQCGPLDRLVTCDPPTFGVSWMTPEALYWKRQDNEWVNGYLFIYYMFK